MSEHKAMPDSPIRSRPYSIDAACEKCVFGRGEHAEWCGFRPALTAEQKTAIAQHGAEFAMGYLEIAMLPSPFHRHLHRAL